MRLKITKIEDGLHPSQVSVSVNARDGVHFVLLNKATIDSNSTIDVGNPVGRREGDFLIELPEETDGGAWRLWVSRNALIDGLLEAAE
jgi:hypothetical protein